MIKIEITNLSEFQKSAESLEKRIKGKIEAALERGAEEVAQGARNRVPVNTGELKESITLKPDKEGLGFSIGTGVRHARFVEFGTLKTSARPFLIPAFEEVIPRAKIQIETALKGALKGQT